MWSGLFLDSILFYWSLHLSLCQSQWPWFLLLCSMFEIRKCETSEFAPLFQDWKVLRSRPRSRLRFQDWNLIWKVLWDSVLRFFGRLLQRMPLGFWWRLHWICRFSLVILTILILSFHEHSVSLHLCCLECLLSVSYSFQSTSLLALWLDLFISALFFLMQL